ncbi:MAG: PKD domain-containing protein [Phycisphaerae bacterium]|nr:PKD domain-containing protein [Phycisphaerae bacterium]
MLGHWRAEGRPDVDEMARVEATIAGDAYSLLACLDLGDASNQAPNVAIEEPNGPGLRLQFTVSASDDGAGLTYAWDFGDDETSGDPSPVHTYGGPGWYLVSCTVTDDDGVSNTDWVYVEALAGLRLDVINGAWGSVEVEPNEPGYADANTVVTLTAFPIEGRVFGHWDRYDPNYPDDANHATVDSNNPLTLVMDTDHHVTAVFKCGSGLGQVFPLLLCVLWLGFLRRGRDRC